MSTLSPRLPESGAKRLSEVGQFVYWKLVRIFSIVVDLNY